MIPDKDRFCLIDCLNYVIKRRQTFANIRWKSIHLEAFSLRRRMREQIRKNRHALGRFRAAIESQCRTQAFLRVSQKQFRTFLRPRLSLIPGRIRRRCLGSDFALQCRLVT